MSEVKSLPLPPQRNLYFSKQVDQESMENLTKAIIKINESDRHLEKIYAAYDMTYKAPPINIYIDSYGGLVYQCFGLIGVMNKSETAIHTYVTGAAMSAGFMILIHGHKRFAYEHSTPLYHQVSSGMWGTSKSIEEEVKELEETTEEVGRDDVGED